jgi:small subunit ribosomal protein MRP21
MAARPLIRYLRAKPASNLLLHMHQSAPTSCLQRLGDTQKQALCFQSIRYSSTNPSDKPSSDQRQGPSLPTNSQAGSSTTKPEKEAASNASFGVFSDYDHILDRLDLGNRQAAEVTKAMRESRHQNQSSNQSSPSRRFPDPYSLSLAVGESVETDNYRAPIRRVNLKLGPMLGRQVHVEPERGVDLAAAIRNVQIGCAVNRIRGQSNLQKFHVRRGQRQKNLRRERWRKLFKFSFNKTVTKIQRMRAQGW